MSRFAIQQTRFNNTLYPGISGWTINPGLEINSDQLDGTVHESAHHLMQTAPIAELTTRDLGFLLNLDGSSDIWLKAFDGTNGLELIGGKAASAAPGYAAGSTHVRRKMARGVLLGTGISWSKGGKAELALRGMGTSSDGTTAALAAPDLIALPTLPVPDFGWIGTAVTLNGETITAIDSLSVTVDPRAEFDYRVQLPEPVDVLMAGVNGAAQWRAAAAVGDCDLGAGTGAVSFVFRRLATGGGFSGSANSTLTITFNANYTVEESLGGQAGSAMTRQLVARPRMSGVTRPVTWAFS